MGTARYLAPEQVSGRPTDARTDVYALGLLMFECLTGHPPFGGDTDVATAMARLTTSAPAVRSERADVPPALDDVIHRCLARDPDQRFESAADVREALRRTELDPTGSVPRVVTGSHALPTVAPPRSGPTTGPAAGPSAGPSTGPSTGPLGSGSAGSGGTAGRDDTGTAPVPRPAPALRRQRRRTWPWVVLLLVAVALLAGAAAALLASDDSKGGGGGGAPAPADVPLTVTADAFDPFGNPPGEENNDDAADAVDGDPTTAWSTERYQNFAEKPGVGLVLDLGRELAVSSVTVDAAPPGWTGRVYTSAQPTSSLPSLADWGEAVANADHVAGASHTLPFTAVRARSVLVWFTSLPAGDGGQSLQVSAVTVG
jgi:hypothetical protein